MVTKVPQHFLYVPPTPLPLSVISPRAVRVGQLLWLYVKKHPGGDHVIYDLGQGDNLGKNQKAVKLGYV
jgi:hypothetical protein